MARLLRIAQATIRRHYFPTRNLINVHPNQFSKPITPTLFLNRAYASDAMIPTSVTTSPLTSNMLRILRTEIECQSESAPPHQPPTSFNSFAVEDRPGEQWITMSGKFGETEEIKIEVTMFDGYETVPKSGDDDSSGVDLRLHLSVIVDISKGDGSENLEFLCSVWPDCVEVQKVYVLLPGRVRAKPYLGPNVRGLKTEIQKKLSEYLEARGVNDELCVFLQQYMMNKDRIELIRWLKNVMSTVER